MPVVVLSYAGLADRIDALMRVERSCETFQLGYDGLDHKTGTSDRVSYASLHRRRLHHRKP